MPVISLATFRSIEEAEEAGRQLLGEGIEPARIEGTELFVDEADLDRASKILDLQDPPPELTRPEPYHPCPSCGVANPVWYGVRKALLLIALSAIVIACGLLRPRALLFVVPAAIVLFAIAILRIPEFECRQCHHRWTKERVD